MFIVGGAIAGGVAHRTVAQRLSVGLCSLLLYVPISFVLEEVSFRGAFDSHLYHPGEPRQWTTALFVSALWGLWHIPVVVGRAPLLPLIPQLLIVHCAVGVPFSIYWRRSGNLFVTGSTHALIDAVRNALFVITWL